MPDILSNQIRLKTAPGNSEHAVTQSYYENLALSLVRYEFIRDNGIPAGLGQSPIWEHKGQFASIKLKFDGYFCAVQARVGAAPTAGTLTIQYRLTRGVDPPAVIVSSGDSLDLSIGVGVDYASSDVDNGIPEYVMEKDDKIEVLITTTSGFVIGTVPLEVILFFRQERETP